MPSIRVRCAGGINQINKWFLRQNSFEAIKMKMKLVYACRTKTTTMIKSMCKKGGEKKLIIFVSVCVREHARVRSNYIVFS